jgi:hypothetical protein
MQAETNAVLKKLEEADWFGHVGEPVEAKVFAVSSWQEAMDTCASSSWLWHLLQTSEGNMRELCFRDEKALDRWEKISKEMDKVAAPLVRKKTQSVVRSHKLPKLFRQIVNLAMHGFLMEMEFADINPPGFFTELATWFYNGHFPCGWEQGAREGRLIVY